MTSDFAPEEAKYPPPPKYPATATISGVYTSLLFHGVSDAACLNYFNLAHR